MRRDYKNAIVLAMSMDQPFRLYTLFHDVMMQSAHDDEIEGEGQRKKEDQIVAEHPACVTSTSLAVVGDKGPTSILGSPVVDVILASLEANEVIRLIGYIRDWNTRVKQSHVAQTVLYALVRFHPHQVLAELPTMAEMIEGVLPYTERHFQRMNQLLTDSYIVDFTLQSMDGLFENDDTSAANGMETNNMIPATKAAMKLNGNRNGASAEEKSKGESLPNKHPRKQLQDPALLEPMEAAPKVSALPRRRAKV
jgi:U3 small nucleolar RNA-associated protein 13